MSLDVRLKSPNFGCSRCLDCYECSTRIIYSSNITHNLNRMAEEAGIYKHCWRPEEIGITKAFQLIEPFRKAIEEMEKDPERFKKFDSSNGFGLYEHFLPWLKNYLKACEENKNAIIEVSR